MDECIRYSEAFKLQVVRELEEGKHANCWAAREAYGIGGATTVQLWVRRYGRTHLLRKVVHVQSPGERNELRKAKDRIAELEKALVDAHLDLRLERAYLEIACEEGWKGSIDELKKKRRWAAAHGTLEAAQGVIEVTVVAVCLRAGMSRQNYYAMRRERQRRRVDEELVVSLVKRERREQPRLGTRKLQHMLEGDLAEAGVEIGRDRMFAVLRANGLLVERKRGRARTTNSRHCLPVFHNLVAGRELDGPNQAWAGDITYIRTEAGFLYAALITDMYSRKIVGSHIGDSLEAEGCIRALDEALLGLPPSAYPIHHSDRGCQYCCHPYVERLQQRELPVSMTEVLHCYENAMAERVNGILKQEYELDRTFKTKAQATKAFGQAVWLYNHRRPHLALEYRTPAQVHGRAA